MADTSTPHSDRDVKGAMEEITYALETLRDCGDRPGMYEDGKIALEHAATVQAELTHLQEQLETLRAHLDAIAHYPKSLDRDVALVNAAKREQREQDWMVVQLTNVLKMRGCSLVEQTTIRRAAELSDGIRAFAPEQASGGKAWTMKRSLPPADPPEGT